VNAAPASVRARIRRLAPETVERIAAGEIVERPASAVKELVENAFDAGATSVSVHLREGGLRRIEVADDGTGIPADELELAVERHATSKLAPLGPVEAITSLGFRGEALAAVAAVSRLRIASRPPGTDVAEGIEVDGVAVVERFAEPRAPGTTVEVAELFFNTPARRKFLKPPAREQLEVLRTVERLYLARPAVAIRLASEAGELASFPATSRLEEAAAHVLGPDFPRASFRLRGTGPDAEVEGVLGLPALAGPTFAGLHLAVNGRPVASRALAQAVRAGFGDVLPRARFPVGVVHLSVPPEQVDVNVHPTKREVRLAAARPVEDWLRREVRAALVAASRLSAPAAAPARPRVVSAAPGPDRGPALPAPSGAAVGGPVQRTLAVGPATSATVLVAAGGGRPRLELLGAVGALYWVAATDDGLVLIDQHAASERLLYDTLRAGGVLARQTLVEPVALTLTAGDRAALAAHGPEVRATGFEVEPFGPGSFRVLSVPSYRGRSAPAAAVVELVRELAAGGRATLPDGLEERRAASIACHAAIRAGDVVERVKLAELLGALDRLPDRPRSCPHGRPIFVHLPRTRLDRWFLRSGA
jgi:DNA mismatch repair protein MutL